MAAEFPPPSKEQLFILDNLEIPGSHIIVDAVAGSGKSTSVLQICERMPDKLVLQFTYNASLRTDLKGKSIELGIQNLHVHTYHSCAVKHYNRDAYTDSGLRKLINNNSPLLQDEVVPYYDVIVLDETQDMSFIYYKFVQKYLLDMRSQSGLEHTFQLVILGDYRQSLYEFKGSDFRYLTLAEILWKDYAGLQSHEDGGPKFVRAQLKTSYRVTNEMAHFVNETLLGEQRLDAIKGGTPVSYIRRHTVQCIHIIVAEIKRLMVEEGAKPEDFFVLAGSVRSFSGTARKLENELVENDIACFLPNFEGGETDERTTHGKIVFSSFHAVKGRQRPYVFVLDFSQRYMDFAMRDKSQDECPNTLYVACTRATKRLYVHENVANSDEPCQFLKHTHLELRDKPYVNFDGQILTGRWKKIPMLTPAVTNPAALPDVSSGRVYTTVTDLLRFISEETYDILLPLMSDVFVCENEALETPIEVPIVHECANGNFEEVADLNGLVIPIIYFDRIIKPQMTGGRSPSIPQKRKRSVDENDGRAQPSGVAFTAQFSSIIDLVKREMLIIKAQKRGFGRVYDTLAEVIPTFEKKTFCTADYLFLANAHKSLRENLFFKLRQINRQNGDYNWLSSDILKQCFDLLKEAIPPDSVSHWKFEDIISECNDESINAELDRQTAAANIPRKFAISARIDVVADDCVYEIKCTSQLTTEHLLQLCLYGWICRTIVGGDYKKKTFKILNIRSGERLRLECSDETLCFIAHTILRNKIQKNCTLTDTEFLNQGISSAL